MNNHCHKSLQSVVISVCPQNQDFVFKLVKTHPAPWPQCCCSYAIDFSYHPWLRSGPVVQLVSAALSERKVAGSITTIGDFRTVGPRKKAVFACLATGVKQDITFTFDHHGFQASSGSSDM